MCEWAEQQNEDTRETILHFGFTTNFSGDLEQVQYSESYFIYLTVSGSRRKQSQLPRPTQAHLRV